MGSMPEERKEAGRAVCVINRLEEETAVLQTKAKETISVPRRLLPQGAAEGATVVVDLQTPDKAGDQSQTTAKNVLNELFGNEVQ